MSKNTGVPASPSGSRASHGAAEASPPEASIPNAAQIAAECESAARPHRSLDKLIGDAVGLHDIYGFSLDCALSLLEPANDWRRLTPKSMSVYAASPYNAAAQVRYDGYGATPALQLCAAFFKMIAAREAKASAIEARRAAAENTGAVHESAVPKGDADA